MFFSNENWEGKKINMYMYLNFFDPQPQNIFLLKKCHLSFKLYKLNQIKRNFIDGIHTFCKIITGAPLLKNVINIHAEIKLKKNVSKG